jgi:hypothetical protein
MRIFFENDIRVMQGLYLLTYFQHIDVVLFRVVLVCIRRRYVYKVKREYTSMYL